MPTPPQRWPRRDRRETPWGTRLRKARAHGPAIIAHRGDSFRAPENTLEAARLARQAGAIAWELDVHLTYDGVPIVIHDESLRRTTNVETLFQNDQRADLGFPVGLFRLDEIARLDAGSWFLDDRSTARSAHGFGSIDRIPSEIVERCRSGLVKIPTLHDALLLTKELDWWVNVEIKSFPNADDRIVKQVVTLIDQLNMADRVLISSFHHGHLAEVVRNAPVLTTGLLVDQPLFQTVAYLSEIVGADFYHPSADVLGGSSLAYLSRPSTERLRSSETIELLTEGCPILAYTVNDISAGGLASHLAELGISAFFSDDPGRMVKRFQVSPQSA